MFISTYIQIEWKEKESKGEFSPQWNKDALNMALGKPDHYGRVVGYGGINVGYKKTFGKSASKAECDRATLKAELREELREELNASMKDNLSTILQSMGVVIPSPSTSHLQPTQSPISPPQLEVFLLLHNDIVIFHIILVLIHLLQLTSFMS